MIQPRNHNTKDCIYSAHADPVIRQDYLDMEQRWLRLAHSYTILERVTAFTAAKPRGRKRRLDEIIRPGPLLQGTDAFPEDALAGFD